MGILDDAIAYAEAEHAKIKEDERKADAERQRYGEASLPYWEEAIKLYGRAIELAHGILYSDLPGRRLEFGPPFRHRYCAAPTPDGMKFTEEKRMPNAQGDPRPEFGYWKVFDITREQWEVALANAVRAAASQGG